MSRSPSVRDLRCRYAKDRLRAALKAIEGIEDRTGGITPRTEALHGKVRGLMSEVREIEESQA